MRGGSSYHPIPYRYNPLDPTHLKHTPGNWYLIYCCVASALAHAHKSVQIFFNLRCLAMLTILSCDNLLTGISPTPWHACKRRLLLVVRCGGATVRRTLGHWCNTMCFFYCPTRWTAVRQLAFVAQWTGHRPIVQRHGYRQEVHAHQQRRTRGTSSAAPRRLLL